MNTHEPDPQAMHDALNRISRQADLENANIDLATVSAGIHRGRRRREMRQRAGVGAMALALIGGVAYGGIQIFGNNDGNTQGTQPEPIYADSFPGWEELQCDARFPDEISRDDSEPRLAVPREPIFTTAIYPPPDVFASELGDQTDLSTGPRAGSSIEELGVWIHNPKDAESFSGGSTGHAAPVVVKDGRVVGTLAGMPEPWMEHELAPDQMQALNTVAIEPCDGFDGTFDGTEEIYYVLDVTTADADSENLRVWGGPWTLDTDGDPDPDPADEYTKVAVECSTYPADGNGDITDGVDCPLTISVPTSLLEEPVSVPDFVNAAIELGYGLSGVDSISGKVRPMALVEIRDAEGNIVNPEIHHSDDRFDDFTVTSEQGYNLSLYSGVDADNGGAIRLEPGVYEVTLAVDLQLDTSDDEAMRLTTAPISIEISDPDVSTSTGTDETSSNTTPREEVPTVGTTATPVCTFATADDGAWEDECPFTVHTSLNDVIDAAEIEDVVAWIMLDDAVYSVIGANYGEASLQMAVSDRGGSSWIGTGPPVDSLLREFTLTDDNAEALRAHSEASSSDWAGLEPGEYTAHFTLNIGVTYVEHNPSFTGEAALPEVPGDPSANWHYGITSTWQIDFTVN